MMTEEKIEIKNAIIQNTHLGFEDHGVFTCYLWLDYGGIQQSFGGYSLDTPVKKLTGGYPYRRGTDYGMEFINLVLRTVGVEKWEDLKGKYIRVCTPTGLGSGPIIKIGHIIKDIWFEPKVDLKHLEIIELLTEK